MNTKGHKRDSVYTVKIPLQVWRIMTPAEYSNQYESFGKHIAVSQEIVKGCQEVHVYLGGFVKFEQV